MEAKSWSGGHTKCDGSASQVSDPSPPESIGSEHLLIVTINRVQLSYPNQSKLRKILRLAFAMIPIYMYTWRYLETARSFLRIPRSQFSVLWLALTMTNCPFKTNLVK